MDLKKIFNKNFIIMLVLILILWLVSVVALFVLSSMDMFNYEIGIVFFASFNVSAGLVMVYMLSRSRYTSDLAENKDTHAIYEFLFAFLPPILDWALVVFATLYIFGCGVAGRMAFCLAFIPLALFGPALAFSIFLGLSSIYLGYFFKKKEFSRIAKIGCAILLVYMFLPAIGAIIAFMAILNEATMSNLMDLILALVISITLPLIAMFAIYWNMGQLTKKSK